jgi:hypothetical protein
MATRKRSKRSTNGAGFNLNGKPLAAPATPTPEPPPGPSESREFAGDTGVLSTCRPNVRTVDELLDYMKVDRTEWDVERFVCNKWEVGGKPARNNSLRGNTASGFAVEPLYQVKVWLRRKTRRLVLRSMLAEMLTQFKAAAPKPARVKYPKGKGCLLEVDIFDAHFGKLCWGKESGQDYDLKIATQLYGEAVEGLLARAGGYPIREILLPLGNDLFHVDNPHNTTAAGTPQDCDGRSHKVFSEGRAAMKNTIDRLRQIAPVQVLMVPGNHDPESVFYLGEVLQGWFHRTPGVTIDNSPLLRKYHRYGVNLLGFTHGNKERHHNLPLLMATEQKAAWAATKFREFHIGHFHKLNTIHFQPVQEFNSIRVRTLSSLTPPDAWHKSMGYEGLRAAQAFVWDAADGCIGQLAFNV